MNEEIKEILELFKEYASGGMSGLYPPEETISNFLDYITNLQEEYEKEHYLVDKLTRQLNDEYKNTEYQCKQKEKLQEENERLRKELELCKKNGEI